MRKTTLGLLLVSAMMLGACDGSDDDPGSPEGSPSDAMASVFVL